MGDGKKEAGPRQRTFQWQAFHAACRGNIMAPARLKSRGGSSVISALGVGFRARLHCQKARLAAVGVTVQAPVPGG